MKSDIITKEITKIQRKINREQDISRETLSKFIENVSLANSFINTITNFVTKKNFLKATQDTTQDIVGFIKDYIQNIYLKLYSNLTVNFHGEVQAVKHFVPFEITMIIDNLIGNSRKKAIGATRIDFHFSIEKDILTIVYKDNGKGLDKSIKDANAIFEEGFTTTNGSGLGLAHIKKIINKMGGEIMINSEIEEGIEFIIRI